MRKTNFVKAKARVAAAVFAAAMTVSGVAPAVTMTIPVMAEGTTAKATISLQNVREGSTVTAYPLVEGVYTTTGALSKYQLTSLGSGIVLHDKTIVTDELVDEDIYANSDGNVVSADEFATVTIDDLVSFNANSYVDTKSTFELGDKTYALLSDGTRYAYKDEAGNYYRVGFVKKDDTAYWAYSTYSLTETSNFLAAYASAAANRVQDDAGHTTYGAGTALTAGASSDVKDTNTGKTNKECTYTANVAPGLYLVLVTSGSGDTDTVYNPVLLSVGVTDANDVAKTATGSTVSLNGVFKNGTKSAYVKKSGISMEKKIINVSEGTTDGTASPNKSAKGDAVEVGDEIEFQIDNMTIPSYSDDYKQTGTKTVTAGAQSAVIPTGIVYKITDTLEKDCFGAVYDIVVKVGDDTIYSTDSEVKGTNNVVNINVSNTYTDGQAKLEITLEDEYVRANAGKKVTVTYKARLLPTAGVNYAENVNHAELEYTNNPADNSTKTIKKNTYHYTFGIDANIDAEASEDGKKWETHEINKVTSASGDSAFETKEATHSNTGATSTLGSKDPLSGATFGLFSDTACKTPLTRTQRTGYQIIDNKTTWTESTVAYTATSDENGHITFTGLDEGVYYMKETNAPSGYTLSANIYKIVINGEFDADTGIMKSYSITTYKSEDGGQTFDTTPVGSATYTNNIDNATVNEATGDVTNAITNTNKTGEITPVEVTNLKNQTLPATGGEGRYAVYLTAAALGGALVVLVGLKKKEEKKEA